MNIFAISGLINLILSSGLGVLVVLRNIKSRVNQLYFFLAFSVALWSFGYWNWQLSTNAESALFWCRILSIGSILIPVFYFHWIISLINLNKKEKYSIISAYILACIFIIFSFSKLFVQGVEPKIFFSFWPIPGILYHFYLGFVYTIITAYSLFLLIKEYSVAKGEKKAQIIYVITGSILGFGGGATNFLLWYNIPFPPYGNFLVAFYPILLGYAVIKHHLFDVKVIATEFLTFALWITLLVKIFFYITLQDLIVNICIFLVVLVFGILLIRGVSKDVRQKEEMKKQKEEVERLNKEIQRAYEVEKKAKELEVRIRKDLERIDKAKTQFMQATQHHLRTPLTSMRGYVDLALGGSYGKLSPELKEVLMKFEISGKRLVNIINELLDVSQFQLGKDVVSLKPGVDINPILKEITEELRFNVKAKNLYLKLEKPKSNTPKIIADEGKLKVALFNIADNAVKYTNKGGITIKVEETDHMLRIIFKDTGMGIPKEDLPDLFTKTFERGEMAKKADPMGRGIGMYLSYKIIESHKGKMWAESEGIGKGSSFFVELPVG